MCKIGATSCQILEIKCVKFDFHWGSALDPALGAHSALPDPLAGFNGFYFYGRGKEGGQGKGIRKGGKRGKGMGGRGRDSSYAFCLGNLGSPDKVH